MFDHIKVNQNSIINLLKTPERENIDIISKKPDKDFFSMVMENKSYELTKSSSDNKSYRTEETQKPLDKLEQVKSEQTSAVTDNSRINTNDDRESNSKENRKAIQENKEVKTDKQESKAADTKKSAESQTKTAKNKDNNEIEDETGIINQLHGEINIKKLIDLLKAVISGDKKAEEESFQKLFSGIKFKNEKDNNERVSFFMKNESDKNHKNISDIISTFTKELRDLIGKELFKNLESRKSAGKTQIPGDKELRQLALDIIEGIKNTKAKDKVKHEAKIVSNDDLKNDKKLSLTITADQQPAKKIETGDESSFERNGSREKNSGRESFSYNGGKIDFASKSGLERMEHNLKNLDFKENLQEIIDKAKVAVRDSKNGSFTVRLNPQELGNVNVNLVMENGVITGKFLVDNEDVKSMLLNSLNDLKYQFEEAGIAFGEFSVNVNDQHERYLKQKGDQESNPLTFHNADREVIAAADQYNSAAAAHNGHINMVI